MSRCCFTRNEVPADFHDPYIETGYRKPPMSAFECLKSSLVFSCNESFNILSHFIAFLFYTVVFLYHFAYELDIREPHTWPLACHAFGNIAFSLMSSIAHTFNSMSPRARHMCFFLDYAAISIYAVGAGQAFFFYTRPLHNTGSYFTSALPFNTGCVLVSVVSTMLNCFSRIKWTSMKYVIRTASYSVAFIWNITPYYYRLYACNNKLDCDNTGKCLFNAHMLLFGLTALANIAKFPEKHLPKRFDSLGQSHNLMHVFISIGCYLQFQFTRHEMKRVARQQNKMVAYENALYCMFVAVALNLFIALRSDTSEKEKTN